MSSNTPFHIRAATASDQPTIIAIIREARIFPFGLKWEHFVVAEADGEIIGVGQIKPHIGGASELASIAVIPARQKEGIARKIIETLLAAQPEAIYLTCHISLEPFYKRFGFRRLGWHEMPLDFKRIKLFLLAITPIGHYMSKGNFHVLVMGRRGDFSAP